MTVDALLVAMLVRLLLTLGDVLRVDALHRLALPLFALGSDSACSLNVDTCCVVALLALDLSRGSVSVFSLSLH